jgi:hypothetical protein
MRLHNWFRPLLLGWGCGWLACGVVAAPGAALTPEAEGLELAREIRSTRPPESFTNQAVLRIRDAAGHRTQVPISIVTRVGAGESWQVTYETRRPAGAAQEKLVIEHRPSQAPSYVINGQKVEEASTPFAGSDFWPMDLGLEFLHWTGQRLIRQEKPVMRKGMPCRVLESWTTDSTRGYVRVRSWIDMEHRQPLMAEAYDAQGRLIKEFSVGSVAKDANGVYQLKNLEMINEVKGTETRLEFQLSVKQ